MTDEQHLKNGLVGLTIKNVIVRGYDPEHGIAGELVLLLDNDIVLEMPSYVRVLWDSNDEDRIRDRAKWLSRFNHMQTTGLTVFETTAIIPVDARHREALLRTGGFGPARLFEKAERGFCTTCKEIVPCHGEMINPPDGFPTPTFIHKLTSGPFTGRYCGPLQQLGFHNATFQATT